MKEGGTAVLCLDNAKVRRLSEETEHDYVTYGLTEDCDYYAKDICYSVEGTNYDVYNKGKKLASVHLIVPGRHNVLNSLGAFAASVLMGISPETIVGALAKFSGAKRRFETKGKENGIWVVDDYAHHPTEIGATLQAAKETGAKRIVCVFQPHRYTRTKLLYEEFCKCFGNCDKLILTHIYSAGEDPIPGVSGLEEYLFKNCKPGDLVITMGAGDVFRIGEELVKEFRQIEK